MKTYTTRIDPAMGNGGIHYQLAPDQTGHAVQNTRALQLIACITGNSDEPAGNRGSSKAEVDGCPGRATMLSTDYGEDAITWEGRDKSIEDQIPEIQDFVQYLIDNDSPLAERYDNKVPTDEEARWIAERKGGAYRPSTAWPNPKTSWERNASRSAPSVSRCCVTGTVGPTPPPSGTPSTRSTRPTRFTPACACRATS